MATLTAMLADPRRRRAVRETLTTALETAENSDALVVVGIPPTRPDTGFGYIETPEGAGDDDHGIVRWESTVAAAPSGSTAQPVPTDTAQTSFTPDRVGDFLLRLTVVDGAGLTDACSVVVSSRVGPPYWSSDRIRISVRHR